MIDREKAFVVDVIKNDPKMAGKTDDMISKIADGKMASFFKEQTLVAQIFVKDGAKTVGEYLKSVDKDLQVVAFKRVALG
jgi:elongation factor Ts